jgi:hypothetical protein
MDKYDDVIFDGRPSAYLVVNLARVADVALVPYFGRGDRPVSESTEKLLRKVNPSITVVLKPVFEFVKWCDSIARDGWSAVDDVYRRRVCEMAEEFGYGKKA